MQRRQIILGATLFAAIVGMLAILYAAFLRPSYTVLYENLREADAAQIVTELEKQGIAYRLADNGHSVLVPEDVADKARVAIAGSGIAMGGVVGFELFNEADMGLTEFAEKVNYQRALQGELARTIMMMDGIAFARVHLSLPERTLFRTAKATPKAAVTIQTAAARMLDARQVAGIQRLVASAVADMPAHDVAVLDHKGDLISPAAPPTADGGAMDERTALTAYFRARAQSVAEKLLPGLAFELRVTVQSESNGGVNAVPFPPSTPAKQANPGEPSAAALRERNFSLRVALRTEADLNTENHALLRQALTDALGLAPERGDILRFETGPLGIAGTAQGSDGTDAPGTVAASAQDRAIPAYQDPSPTLPERLFNRWTMAALALIALGIALLLRRRARMNAEEQDAFADLLAGHLNRREEGQRHG